VQASSFPASGALKYDLVTGMKIGGAGPYYDLYQGGLDEVAIYNKVLSPARILAHYQAGSP
jgi:hypothetical protein